MWGRVCEVRGVMVSWHHFLCHVSDSDSMQGVRTVSSSTRGLWAVLEEGGGVLARRAGVTPSNPGGEDWEPALGGGWKYVSVRGEGSE